MRSDNFVAQIRKLVGEGAISKACKHLVSDGLHDARDNNVWAQLQHLHPYEEPPVRAPLDDIPRILWGSQLAQEANRLRKLEDIIGHFPPGSAAGPSGLRPAHLKECLLHSDIHRKTDFLRELDVFTRNAINGTIPVQAAPFLCAATLIPLRKCQPQQADSPPEVRPVAVGETLRRIIGKFLTSESVFTEAAMTLQPTQTGVGVRDACELTCMGAQSLVDGLTDHTNWAILQVDFRNAFNTITRKSVLAGTSKYCPHALPWMTFAYGGHSHLICQGRTMPSASGIQQGDPLGPAAFSFGIHDLISQIGDIDGILWNSWYLDDGLLIGTTSALAQAMNIISAAGPGIGLSVNPSKCVLWGPAAETPDFQEHTALLGIPVTPYLPNTGIKVLGGPVQHPRSNGQHARDLFDKKVGSLGKMLDALKALPQAHLQFSLLKGSLDGCRLSFLTRMCPTQHITAGCQKASSLLRTTLGEILGEQPTNAQWQQATLPVRLGGMGIKDPMYFAEGARMASISTFLRLARSHLDLPSDLQLHSPEMSQLVSTLRTKLGQEFQPLKQWAEWITNPVGPLPQEPLHGKQSWWNEKLVGKRVEQLETSLGGRDAFRYRCQKTQRGAAWMSALPNPATGTLLPSLDFKLISNHWLGMDLLPHHWAGARCPKCSCGMDLVGDHLVGCTKNNLQHRHFVVQEALQDICRLSGFTVKREVGVPDGSRPGDLYLPQWDADGPLFIDITCRNPCNLSSPVPDPDALPQWLREQEEDKNRKYVLKCRLLAGASFLPFVLTPWGGLAPQAKTLMFKLVRSATSTSTGWVRLEKATAIWQKLSFAIAKEVGRQLQPTFEVTEPEWAPDTTHSPYFFHYPAGITTLC